MTIQFMSLSAIYAYMQVSLMQNNSSLFNVNINRQLLLYIWWEAGQWPEYTSGYDNLCLSLSKKHFFNVAYTVATTVDCAIQHTLGLFNTRNICPLWIPFDSIFRGTYLSRLTASIVCTSIVVLCPSLIHCIYYSRMTNCKTLTPLVKLLFIDGPNMLKMLQHRDVSKYVFVIDHADIDNVMYSCVKEILSTMGLYMIYIRYLSRRCISDEDESLQLKQVGYISNYSDYISPIIADYATIPHNAKLVDNRKRAVPYVDDFGIFQLGTRYAALHEMYGVTYDMTQLENNGNCGHDDVQQVVGIDCYAALRWAILTIFGIQSGNIELARTVWSNALFNHKMLANSISRAIEPVRILDLSTTFEHRTMYMQNVVVKRFDCDYYTSTQFQVSSLSEYGVHLQMYICLEQYSYANPVCHMLCARNPIYNTTKPLHIDIIYPFSKYTSYEHNNTSNTYIRFDINSVVCGRVESIEDEETTCLPMLYYMLIIRIMSVWHQAVCGSKYKSDKAHLNNLIRFVKSY